MAVSYCERWNRRTMGPIYPLSETEARARHEAGRLYTAVMSGEEFPTLVEVYLLDGYVGVKFLESHGRPALAYVFRMQDDRLFLHQVDVATVNEAGKVVAAETTVISPDGTVEIQRFDNVAGTMTSSGPATGTDVSHLWEDVPAFSDYASIARRER
jgi:hypothetical protein